MPQQPRTIEGRVGHRTAALAWAALCLVTAGVGASPILDGPSQTVGPAVPALSQAVDTPDLAVDATADFVTFESRAESFGTPSAVRLESFRTGGNRTTRGRTSATPAGGPDIATGEGPGLALELARNFVNVTPRGAGGDADGTQSDRPRGPGPNSILDTSDWLRDALLSVVGNTLQQGFNERGEVTFSLLGFGEFGLIVSGDRGVVSLIQGDNVLLAAERRLAGMADGSGNSVQATMTAVDGAESAGPSGSGRSSEGGSEDVVQRAFDLFVEIITHPLAMLCAGVIAGYVLLMQVLTARAARRHGGRHRSSRRHGEVVVAPVDPSREHRRRRRKRSRSQSTSASTQRA